MALATNAMETQESIVSKTAAYRAAERATLAPYGDEWADVKDAIQTALMWSFMYDPREGLVAPMFQFPKGDLYGGFSDPSIDGDTTEGLFCWDGSFASYQLSLDALDLSLSNLIQIIKMRTSAGFIPSYTAGTVKSRDRSNPPVTAKILHEITKRWGANRTTWVVELCFDDLYNWNTWMFTRRRELPLGLMSWGSDPYPYAPDGTNSATHGNGGGGASLESGLDNSVLGSGVPFNRTGLNVQDVYDAGYTGMYLMDCLAQIELAKLIGRDDAVTTLQARFDEVNAQLPKLWNESEGFFQNKQSDPDMTPVAEMAPTNLYPLLVGPAKGPTEAQVVKTVTMHITNRSRFGVWPSGIPPTDHPMPPVEARPLVQWYSHTCGGPHGPCPGSPHQLCCKLDCNAQFNNQPGGYIQRLHAKVRFEGQGLATVPADGSAPPSTLLALYGYNCTGLTPNASDLTMNVLGWQPSSTTCTLMNGGDIAMYVHKARTGPSAADLIPLELWYKPGDHYLVASDEGLADAMAGGYVKIQTLGYVWPPPGSVPGVASRYGLPSISKDTRAYIDQDYWHGRIWAPMIQLTYWGLSQYSSPEATGATDGLVQQSKDLLLRNWRPEPLLLSNMSAAGRGGYVFENYGADDGEGYSWTSSACPLYSWGGLTGFVGLQHAGFYSSTNP